MHGRSGDRVGAADNRYPVPDGFRQLLEALAREVLRGQPDDIYGFSALFFQVLLDMRHELGGENPIHKPELYDKFKRRLFSAAAQQDLVSPSVLSAFPATNNVGKANRTTKGPGGSAEDLDIDLTDPELNKAAIKIQATYRGFAVRSQGEKPGGEQVVDQKVTHRHGDGVDQDRAATKIQANIRGYLTRKQYKAGTLKPAPRGPKKAKKGPKRPTNFEDNAASKIQAGVRGYLTRKHLASDGIPVKSPTSHTSRSPIPGEDFSPKSPTADIDVAASKIQAGVRGYLTRKQLAARGVPVHSPTHHSHAKSHQQLDNDPGADDAAAKIQAGVRGYLTRKHLDKEGLRKSPARNAKMETRRVTIANVDDAATKIQAGIRGYLTRKHLEAQGISVRSGGASPSSSSPMSPSGPGGVVAQHNHVGDDGIGSPDDAEEAAATKIQAAFRGHRVRQQFKPGDKDFDNDDGEFI